MAVVDGLTPETLERGIAAGRLPTLAAVAERGSYRRGVTVFPSVTPVCMTSLVTGAYPDVHHVPHIAWYHRGERRVVEYGSSFAAMRAVGPRRCARDAVFGLTGSHLSASATTVFEALEDSGLVAAAVNVTCYRGRTRHAIRLPGLAARNRWYEAVHGPRRFFFYNLFESDDAGGRIAVRSRPAGSVDAYATAVGRWLVTRDGFDFLLFYLPDYDYASHAAGPESALPALERADASLARVAEAAGGLERFLERYALVVTSDHGQTKVERVARLQRRYADLGAYSGRRRRSADRCRVAVTASNRAGMVYRLSGCALSPRELGERLDDDPAADVVLLRDDGVAVARRDGSELRFAPETGGRWRLEGDAAVLDPARYPNGLERAWRALACPHAGDVLVSATAGWEFADVGGGNHAGGGSHGSLLAGDSVVPVLAAGLAAELPERPRLTDLAPLALAHLGVRAAAPVREERVA